MHCLESPPTSVFNAGGRSDILIVCEHASQFIPLEFDGLGLSAAELKSHIAWDIGAAAVAQLLAGHLDATLVTQRYSRLLYDCNRPPSAPSSIPVLSELTVIPGNQNLSQQARQLRIDSVYTPFHTDVAKLIDARVQAGIRPKLVTLHSFTSSYKGVLRELDLGVICDDDARFSDALIDQAAQGNECVVQKNEPYSAEDGVTHTLQRQSQSHDLHNTMLEIRNDLIKESAGQHLWAQRLARWLGAAAGTLG